MPIATFFTIHPSLRSWRSFWSSNPELQRVKGNDAGARRVAASPCRPNSLITQLSPYFDAKSRYFQERLHYVQQLALLVEAGSSQSVGLLLGLVGLRPPTALLVAQKRRKSAFIHHARSAAQGHHPKLERSECTRSDPLDRLEGEGGREERG